MTGVGTICSVLTLVVLLSACAHDELVVENGQLKVQVARLQAERDTLEDNLNRTAASLSSLRNQIAQIPGVGAEGKTDVRSLYEQLQGLHDSYRSLIAGINIPTERIFDRAKLQRRIASELVTSPCNRKSDCLEDSRQQIANSANSIIRELSEMIALLEYDLELARQSKKLIVDRLNTGVSPAHSGS